MGANFTRSLNWFGTWGAMVPESIRFGKEASVSSASVDVTINTPMVAKKSVEIYSRNSYIYNNIRTLDAGKGTEQQDH
jgi:hypothetical protein